MRFKLWYKKHDDNSEFRYSFKILFIDYEGEKALQIGGWHFIKGANDTGYTWVDTWCRDKHLKDFAPAVARLNGRKNVVEIGDEGVIL